MNITHENQCIYFNGKLHAHDIQSERNNADMLTETIFEHLKDIRTFTKIGPLY